jgi:hypothetical protein
VAYRLDDTTLRTVDAQWTSEYAPMATRPSFQTKTKPRTRPLTTVEDDCTMLLKHIGMSVMIQLK